MLDIIRNISIKNKYKNAQLIIWDLDETLFFSNKIIKLSRYTYFLLYLKNNLHKNNKFKHVLESFLIKEKESRWFEIIANDFNITFNEAMIIAENIIKKENYIQKNDKLVSFFNKSDKKHIVLTNSSTNGAKKILRSLGFEHFNDFADILGIDLLVSPKPEIKVLKDIVNKYSIPCDKCLVIGNSFKDDLDPALKLNMKVIHISNQPENYRLNSIKSINKLVDWIYE